MKNNIFALKIFSLLIYILPITLITGSFLPDFIISFAGILFIFFTIKYKEYNYYKNIFFIFFFIFFLFLLLSSLFSINKFFSLQTSLVYIRFGILSLIVLFCIENNQEFLKNFRNIIFITISVLVVDSYIQLIFDHNLLGFYRNDPKRLSGLFGNRYILGTFLLKISPILLYLFFIEKKKYQYFILFYFLIFIEPIIFFSGQRSIFYLSLILIVNFYIFIRIDKKIILASLVIFLILFLTLNYNKTYNERMIRDVISNFKFDTTISESNDLNKKILNFSIFSPIHTSLYLTSLNMFEDKKILGQGPKMFRMLCDQYKQNEMGCSTHPHNYYMQALSELGLVGILFLAIFYISLLYFYFKIFITRFAENVKKVINCKIFIIIGLLIVYFPLSPHGDFFNNWNNILNYLLIGFLINKNKTNYEY
jgi:O-antigen ligase